MKRNIPILLVAALAVFALAFSPSNEDSPVVHDHTNTIQWEGKKVTGSHKGTVTMSAAEMQYDKEGKLTSASFTADMTTMVCTDLGEGPGAKLIGHLMSNDFFAVNDYPESTFSSTSITDEGDGKYNITGDLTIKGKTHAVTFPAMVANVHGMKNATATVSVDRTKYDIKYGSGSFFEGLGDNMINDEFTLDVSVFSK